MKRLLLRAHRGGARPDSGISLSKQDLLRVFRGATLTISDFDVGEELRGKLDFIDDRPFSQGVEQQQRVTMSLLAIERVVQDDIGVVGEAIA